MRFAYHFKPGNESAGLAILTDFTTEARSLLNFWEKKRGHKNRLGARVPSRPQTALTLGYDAVTWAQRKLIDFLVVTPFWATIEPDMPIELWKEMLRGTSVTLAAGLELLLRPYPDNTILSKLYVAQRRRCWIVARIAFIFSITWIRKPGWMIFITIQRFYAKLENRKHSPENRAATF